MAISKTFRDCWVSGWNGIGDNPRAYRDGVRVSSGYCIKDNRAVRPIPLVDTDMYLERNTSNGNYSYRQGIWSGNVWWCYTGWEGSSDYSDNRPGGDLARQRAISKFGQSDLDLGQTLPMLRRTVSDIVKDLNRVTDLAAKITIGDIPGVANAIGRDLSKSERRRMNSPASVRLADNWLNYEYNWRQNIQDVYNAFAELRKGLMHEGDKVRSGSGRKDRSPSGVLNQPNGTLPEGVKLPSSPQEMFGGSSDRVGDAYASVHGVVSNPIIAELNALGLVNPALIAWNLLPYSFVADWVLPISDILRSFTSGLGYSSLSVSVVTEERMNYYIKANHVWTGSSQRVRRGYYAVPPLSTQYATLQKAVSPSVEKAANAAALLRQAFHRNR